MSDLRPQETVLAQSGPADADGAIPIRRRLAKAAWSGAAGGGGLGLIAALGALLISTMGGGGNNPLIQADRVSVILSAALIGTLVGVVSATFARMVAERVGAGMRLSSPMSATGRLGAIVGLVLGALEGSVLTGILGPEFAGSPGPVEMSLLATFTVMLVGGALLGTLSAIITQVADIPIAVSEDVEEITTVRKRLAGALEVPLIALLILIVIVLPIAWVLLESDQLASGGAVIVGIVAALAILALASSGRTLPRLRIPLGGAMLSNVVITAVVVAIAGLLVFGGLGGSAVSGGGGTVAITATADITFDQTAWTSEAGPINLIYTDQGSLRHTLLVEGYESKLELEVKQDGQVEQGVIDLPAGTYTLYCGVKGHRQAGMEGTLTVTAAPPEPES